MKDAWEREATHPSEYHIVECQRGREFIIRLTTGADVYKAIQQFAKDKGIKFGKIHAAFMGGFSPAKMFMWCPDPHDPNNWHNESAASIQNISMLIAMSGMIHTRPTIGGHLTEGTLVKGVVECFITEILGIEELLPSDYDPTTDSAPEEWYKEV